MLPLRRRTTTLASRLLVFRTRRLQNKQSCRCTSSDKRRSVNSTVRPQTKNIYADNHDVVGVPEPTNYQLYVVALHQAIPFVGFGIMDNAILILAGEAIDVYLGAALGLSTMCAAAIGNIISNWSGVGLGTVIEDAMQNSSTKMKSIPPLPKLTHEQRGLRSVRLSGQLGCAAGLTVGCIIGMIPLLFFPNDHAKDNEKKDSSSDSEDTTTSLELKDNQIRQLEKEIHQWKEKHADAIAKLKVLESEKLNGGIR